ncbi:hypothetical protein [Curtobacterium sp. MCPF17_052]|uniref:hypothetical protein n=1 Tax=Curtobacterium sp. MCPF17_052 TaxID=2175655 RepID=UPI0024DFF0C0|nr:hypothetical protein [Curtobacterium sp. MCPF17_052]WIB11793.1 hypothetical protein DEJ36_12980 [Curtobacterium sp. MCPF17_052]
MTQRGSTWGFWLWAISGVVVSIAAGVLLGSWFRIAAAVTIGWGVFAVTAFPTRARLDVRQPWLWGVLGRDAGPAHRGLAAARCRRSQQRRADGQPPSRAQSSVGS